MQETWVRSLGGEDLLGEGMATCFSILPEEFHGPRNLASYRTWGCKELDMTEATYHAHIHKLVEAPL